jgi:hypothetical protein
LDSELILEPYSASNLPAICRLSCRLCRGKFAVQLALKNVLDSNLFLTESQNHETS